MNIHARLDSELLTQAIGPQSADDSVMQRYVNLAEGYADIENVLVVLSDLKANRSYVVHGKFSYVLDIDTEKCSGWLSSIWEEDIFRTIHPEDLEMKLLHELLYYHSIAHLPKARRFDHCLIQRLRMRNKNGEWVEALHRLYYIPAADGKSIRFSLCLYGMKPVPFKARSLVIDTMTGEIVNPNPSIGAKILSPREVSVLRLIDQGNPSKGIADILGISLHTVSRHRQNIIAKLKVRNSAEACKVARNLFIL